MEEIRRAAVDGYQRMRHGGIEVGGVLFGSRRVGAVRIEAVRPIACEYASGPRFVLSARDEAALGELLRASRQDSDLAGLDPVGWYHSHTRSDISLSAGDLELFNRFFPQPWQIALVVRPAVLTPSRAGFFFREAGGAIRADSSCREFLLPSGMASTAAAA